MFYFLKRVGSNFGVIDDEDGAIDWLTKEELKGVFDANIEVRGISRDMTKLEPIKVSVPAYMCNWSFGINIFNNAKSFIVYEDGSFTLKTDRKSFKGHLANIQLGIYTMEFNFGVRVELTALCYETLLHGEHEAKLSALSTLATVTGDEKVAQVL